MAKKTSYNKSSTNKQFKFNSPWLKNAMKSIGAITRDSFKEISPTIYEVGTTGANAVNRITNTIKSTNVRSISNSLNKNEYVRSGQNLIKYAIEDIKSGKFYNEDRATNSAMKDMGLDDLESGTFFEDWGDESDDDGSGSASVNVVNNIAGIETVGAAVVATGNASNTTNLKIGKAQIDAMVAMTSAQMQQQQEFATAIVGELSNISNGINSMVSFQNENMITFMQSATAYMEKLGAKVEEIGNSKELDPDIMSRKSGGINASNYMELVKKQFKKTARDSMGMLGMLNGPMLEMAISNPLGMIGSMALTSMTPKKMKDMMTEIDEALAGFIPSVLNKLATYADSPAFDSKSRILKYIGSIFGVKTGRKNEFELYNKVTKDAAVFDGVTRHNITEIIPKYLRESTSYLKEIARTLGVNVKDAKGNAEVFNIQEGRYRRVKDVQNDLMDDIRRNVLEAFTDSKFGRTLEEVGSKGLSDREREKFNANLEKFYIALEKHGKFIDPTNLNYGSDLDTILNGLGLSKGELNHLRASLRLTNARSPIAINNMNVAAEKARRSRNSRIQAMSDDPELYNTYAISGLAESIDATFSSNFKRTFGETKRSDATIGDTLRNIQYLLNRGINVMVVGQGTSSVNNGFTPLNTSNKSNRRQIRFNRSNRTANISDSITNLTEDQMYERMVGEFGEGSISEHNSEFARSMATAMRSILSGRFDIAMADIGNAIWQKASGVGSYLNKEFISPLKESLFGTKDKGGYSRDGMFSGVQNKFLDTFRKFKREFDGKGYTDSLGNKVADKGDDEESVLGNIRKFSKDIHEGIMTKLFGEKGENGKRSRLGFMGGVVNTLQEGFKGFSEAFFGKELTEDEKKEILETAKKEMIDRMPRTMTGMLGGVTFNALAGSSLLGGLIGGPIGAALIGGAVGFASKSDKFQEFIFGKEGNDGAWVEGLISKKVQEEFKDKKNVIVGGAAMGMGRSILFGKTGGVLGSLVGGPVAGAILGGAMGYITKTEMFHNFLFGKEGTWQKGIVGQFKSLFGKADKDITAGSKALGMSILGSLGGGLTGAAISTTGLLPAMISPLGPIGGAIAGLAFGIRASKNDFREWLFGKKMYDENGNYIGDKKGVMGQFKVMLNAEIFRPMRSGMANFIDDTRNFFIDRIAAPVEFAVSPITSYMKNLGVKISSRIENFMSKTGDYIKNEILSPIQNTVRKYILSPIRQIFGTFFKVFTGVTKTIIATPFDLLARLGNFADSRNRATSRKQVMRENRQQGLRGMVKNMGIRFHVGNMHRDASEAYYEEGRNRRVAREEEYMAERDERLQRTRDRKKQRKWTDENIRMIAKYTNNNYDVDTVEARAIAQRMYDEQRRSQGKRTKKLKFKGEATMGMGFVSDEDISSRDSSKMGTEERQLKWIIRIANILQGKNPDGTPGDEQSNPFFARGKQKKSKEERDREEYQRRKTWDEETPDDDRNGNINYGRGSNNVDAIFDLLENTPIAKAASRISGGVKNTLGKVKGFFDRRGGSYAKGGEIGYSGLSLVGENGPEIVYQQKGNRVFPNGTNVPVFLTGVSNIVKSIFSKDIAKATSEGISNAKIENRVSNAMLPKLLSSEDGNGTSLVAGSYKETERKKSAALAIAVQNESLTHLRNIDETTKSHSSLWSSVFSKKGLITAGLIALSPILLKLAKKLLDLDWSGFGSTISRIVSDMSYNNSNRGDGKTANEKSQENIEETQSLLKGDWLGWVTPDGEWDHQSSSKLNATTVPIRKGAKAINKAGKVTSWAKNTRLGKAIGKGLSKSKGVIKSTASKLANKFSSKGASKVAYEVVDGSGEVLASFGKNNDVLKTAAKSSKGILNKVLQALDTAISHIVEFLSKHGFKSASKLSTIAKSLKEVCTKYIGKIAPKVTALGAGNAALASATAGIGLAAKEVTWITLGAINGVSGAAKLFYIDKSNVDTKMRLISTAIGGLKGSTVGAIMDIINSVMVEIIGLDVFHEIACTAYDIIASDEDYEKLTTSKEEFKQEYEGYKEEVLRPQYEQFLAENGYTEESYTFEMYMNGVSDGTIKADVDSFVDYNTKQHKSLGDKIGNGIANVGKGIKNAAGKAVSGVKNIGAGIAGGIKAVGSSAVSLAGKAVSGVKSVGSGIVSGAKGAVRSIDNATQGLQTFGKNMASGTVKLGGQILGKAKDATQPLVDTLSSNIDILHKNVNKLGNKLGTWASDTGTKVKDWAGNVGDAVGAFGSSVVEKAGSTLEKAGDLVGWVKTTGSAIGSTIVKGELVSPDMFEISDDDPYSGLKKIGTYAISGITFPFGMAVKFGKGILGGLGSIVGGVADAGKSALSFAKNAVSKAGKGALNFSEQYSKDPGGAISDVFGSVVNTVGGIILHPIDTVTNVFSTIGSGFKTMFNGVKKIGTTIADACTPSTETAISNYFTMKDKEDGILGGLNQIIFTIGRALVFVPWLISKAVDTVKEKLLGEGSLIGNVKEKASSLLSKIGIDLGGNGNGGYGMRRQHITTGGFGAQPDTVNGFPYYSQNDSKWSNKSYSKTDGSDNATYGDAGCGPTAMAMAINGVKGRNVDPVELGALAQQTGQRDDTGTNWNFIDTSAAAYGLNAMRRENPDASFINSQVEQGNPVVLSGTSDNNGPYTTAGHYIVAVGKDKNGNILVNDPRGKNYSKSYKADQLASKTGAAWGIFNGGFGAARNIIKRIKSKSRGGGFGTDTDKWISIVKAVKQAIAAQSPGYSQSNWINITVGGKTLRTRTDCSGFVGACLKFFGVASDDTNFTSSTFLNGGTSSVKNTGFTYGGWPGWDGLQEGDIIATSGHVEIFCRNEGGKHYVYNCGSNSSVNNPNATVTGHPNGYTAVWRPGSAGTGVVADTTSSSSSTSGFTSAIDKIGNIMSTASSLAYQGALTGDWSTSLSQALAGSNTSSNTPSSGASASNLTGNDIKEKVFNFFVSNGYSKEAAAGIMGNMQQESGVNPSLIQGNGKGPAAGIVQWENYNTKTDRWKKMADYASSKGKDWTDLGSQLEYIDMELANRGNVDNYTNYLLQKWYGGYDSFKKINNVNTAVEAFEKTFERAGKPMWSNRYKAAKEYYNMYANKGTGGGYGTYNSKANPNKKQSGTRVNTTALKNISSFRDTDTEFAKNYLSKSNNYITSSGGYGNNNDIIDTLNEVVAVLKQIATSTHNSDSKLDLLKKLSVSSNGGRGEGNKQSTPVNNTSNIIINKNNSQKSLNLPNRNQVLANKIASGEI